MNWLKVRSMLAQDLSLSIGIVVYNPDFKVLAQVLEHLQVALSQVPNVRAQCFIVNNSPVIEAYPSLLEFIKSFTLPIQVINNPANTGYGAGNNLAAKASDCRYYLVLNPDAFLAADALKNALTYLELHPDIGLLCPSILNQDGSRQFVHRRDPTLFDMFLRSFAPKFLQNYFKQRMDDFLLKSLDWDKEQDIASPSGCCMLLRMSIFKEVGGFDEQYFMYYEDSDIGRKIRAIARVVYDPAFKITHLWERASRKSWKMRKVIIKSGFIYFRKWGGWF